MQRQKAWEADLERSAPMFVPDLIEEENEDDRYEESWDFPSCNSQMDMFSQQPPAQHAQDEQVDDFLRRETEEIEALVADMSQEDGEQDLGVNRRSFASDGLWSDDTDYDALFSEVLKQDKHSSMSSIQPDSQQQTGGDEMDMS